MDEFCEFQLRRMMDTEQEILAAVVSHELAKIARKDEYMPGYTKRHAYRMTLIERVRRA